MVATSRSESPRRRLVTTAVELMRRTGLTGAGINELVRESGAPKGSVYHYFPDGKLQIVSEALDEYASVVTAFIDQALGSARSPGGKVRALFAAFAERVERGGYLHSCPAGTVCLDLDGASEPLRRVVAGSLERYAGAIAAHFGGRRSARSASFARLVVVAIEGAYIASRAQRSSAPFREAGRWLATLAEREFRSTR